MNDQPNKPTSLKNKALSLNVRVQDYTRSPYVKGLPEWEMFPDDETRRKVAIEIERGMTPRSLKGLLQFLVAAAIFLSVPMLVAGMITKWVLPSIGFSLGAWQDLLFYGLTLIGYVIVVYLAIRRDMPRELRKKLVACGVPVCLGCGYDLRGQPTSSTRCPECGRTFDAKTMTLVQQGLGESSVDASAAGSSRE